MLERILSKTLALFFFLRLSTRLQEKILRIIDSATDTELVDLCMRDTLSKGSYMRFNPYTSYPYSLDEIDPKKFVIHRYTKARYGRRNFIYGKRSVLDRALHTIFYMRKTAVDKQLCKTFTLYALFRLEQMSQDAQLYISRNKTKFEATAKILLAKPSLKQRFLRNWNKLII